MPRQLPQGPISPLAKRLAKNLHAVRKQLGWSQTRVAKAAGLSLTSYSRIETGKQLPALPRIDTLARVLGVPLTSLLLVTDTEGSRWPPLMEFLQELPAEEQEFIYGLIEYCARQLLDVRRAYAATRR